jgi:chromosome segregation ATPase
VHVPLTRALRRLQDATQQHTQVTGAVAAFQARVDELSAALASSRFTADAAEADAAACRADAAMAREGAARELLADVAEAHARCIAVRQELDDSVRREAVLREEVDALRAQAAEARAAAAAHERRAAEQEPLLRQVVASFQVRAGARALLAPLNACGRTRVQGHGHATEQTTKH